MHTCLDFLYLLLVRGGTPKFINGFGTKGGGVDKVRVTDKLLRNNHMLPPSIPVAESLAQIDQKFTAVAC